MSNILNTRKTVKHYIWYNLGMIFISFMLVFSFSLMYDPVIIKMTDSVTKNMNENTFYIIVTLFFILSYVRIKLSHLSFNTRLIKK